LIKNESWFRLAPTTNPGGSGKVATTLGSVSARQ
jgi:hypothetical protein